MNATSAGKVRLRLNLPNMAIHLYQVSPGRLFPNPGVLGADSGPSPSPSTLPCKQGANGWRARTVTRP